MKTSLELKLPPVLQLFIAGVLMFALYRLAGQLGPGGALRVPLDPFWAHRVALLLAFSGVLIALLGVLAFRRASTTVDPRYPDKVRELVASGVYRWTRNPMYLGMLLVLTAWGVYLSSLLAFVVLPAFVLYVTRFQIIPEESAMRANFAESYTDYCHRVRRWL
jgi:protein-S-isoprenylcysteine O-methyltransferase Ste14